MVQKRYRCNEMDDTSGLQHFFFQSTTVPFFHISQLSYTVYVLIISREVENYDICKAHHKFTGSAFEILVKVPFPDKDNAFWYNKHHEALCIVEDYSKIWEIICNQCSLSSKTYAVMHHKLAYVLTHLRPLESQHCYVGSCLAEHPQHIHIIYLTTSINVLFE